MNKNKTYQICTKCVMDTTASEIVFDEKGVCNFCKEFEAYAIKTIWRKPEVKKAELKEEVNKLKKLSIGNKYDCLIGLSGGVDSSYLCYWAKQENLNPLIVHFDNGWNSELAVKNIENIISATGFDLYTYVIDWEDFKDLQLSYIKASVIDIEVPTDQLIYAALYKIAKKYNIKSIISGTNISSEFILPSSWIFQDKHDVVNLTEIHKKFGTRKLKKFPKLGLNQKLVYKELYNLFSVGPLDLIDYDTQQAKEILKKEFNWQDYGGKHYESVFTRFYQGYILPHKFNVDKRKAHLASLVAAKIMTRSQAIEELKKPPYDPQLLIDDYNFVIKKFGITDAEFKEYMAKPIVDHRFYGTQWDKKHFRKHFYFKKVATPFLKFISFFKS